MGGAMDERGARLYLPAVQVDAADAIDPHRFHHLGDVRRGDRHARALLAVLPRVAVVRHDRRHMRGGGAPHCRSA